MIRRATYFDSASRCVAALLYNYRRSLILSSDSCVIAAGHYTSRVLRFCRGLVVADGAQGEVWQELLRALGAGAGI